MIKIMTEIGHAGVPELLTGPELAQLGGRTMLGARTVSA